MSITWEAFGWLYNTAYLTNLKRMESEVLKGYTTKRKKTAVVQCRISLVESMLVYWT